MQDDEQDLLKRREIGFCGPHEITLQSRAAMLMLSDLEGIQGLEPGPDDQDILWVTYNIKQLSLHILEELLEELGFHLDNSLLFRLKRGLYYYTEDLQRESLGCPPGQDCARKIFINRYRKLPHGCRDGRPNHWRHYL